MARRRRASREQTDAVSPEPLAELLSPLPEVAEPLSPFNVFDGLGPSRLTAVEDFRTYHPLEVFRAPRQVSGHPVERHKVSKPTKGHPGRLSFGLKFADSKRTVVCVRRKQRKEVLHALQKTGRGGGRRKPRRNYNSSVSC